jgi:hypothetical protein
MTIKIPKTAKVFALTHFVISSGFLVSLIACSYLWPNKEGTYPLLLVFVMMFLSVIDYPLMWLFENVSFIKSSPYLFFSLLLLFGTIMWFAIGLLFQRIINKFSKTDPPGLAEKKPS